jgi:NAD(P)-dependent dehydrogenase (short-subunit alcohol dehydrogenase family)
MGVDILVNVVGGSNAPGGGFAALTDHSWRAELERNSYPAVRFDRALLPGMIRQGYGVIIHVSSIQRRPSLYEAALAYAAAKAALTTYSKGLSIEVGSKGIRVNTICPGFIESRVATALIQRLAEQQGTYENDACAGLMQSLGGIPIGKPGRPEEALELAAFILSDRAPSIHGAEYTIDGGTIPAV